MSKKIEIVFSALAAAVILLSVFSLRTAYADGPEFLISGVIDGLVDGKILMNREITFDPEKVIESNEEMMALYFESGEYTVTSWGRDDEYALYEELSPMADNLIHFKVPAADFILGDAVQFIFKFGDYGDCPSEYISIAGDFSKYGKVYYPDADPSNPALHNTVSLTYTGKALKPKVLVFYNAREITEGTDYTVSYKNNVKAGTAKVTVTGKGNYVGSISKTFTINKAANTLKIKAKKVSVRYSKLKKAPQKLSVSKVIKFSNKGQGSKIYKKISGNKNITINKTTGKVTVKKGLAKGTYKVKVKVRAKGNSNYKASAWKKVTFTVIVK